MKILVCGLKYGECAPGERPRVLARREVKRRPLEAVLLARRLHREGYFVRLGR